MLLLLLLLLLLVLKQYIQLHFNTYAARANSASSQLHVVDKTNNIISYLMAVAQVVLVVGVDFVAVVVADLKQVVVVVG